MKEGSKLGIRIEYNETRLDNGVRVISASMPHVNSAAMGLWAGVGGRYEPARLSGISHFIEHLLFKGTRKRSARDISQAIEGRGGYFNAFTQEESTCYYGRVASIHTEKVFDILADMYLNAKFSPSDIERERGVILEEIMMYRDQPEHLVQDALGQMLWVNHPVGRPLIGTADNLARMTRDDIIEFKNNKYVAENTVASFAGNIEHMKCVRRAEKLLGGMNGGKIPRCRPVTRTTVQSRQTVINKEIEQTHLAMGFRLFGRKDPRRFTLKLISIILGENTSSRLFQSIREQNGLAYSVSSGMHLFRDTGALVISAGLDRKRAGKAMKLIVRELNRMKNKRVSQRELRRAKDYAIGQLSISLENTISQMMWIGDHNVSLGRFLQPEEIIKEIESVSERDISNLAGEVIRSGNASTAMISPEDRSRHEEILVNSTAQLGS